MRRLKVLKIPTDHMMGTLKLVKGVVRSDNPKLCIGERAEFLVQMVHWIPITESICRQRKFPNFFLSIGLYLYPPGQREKKLSLSLHGKTCVKKLNKYKYEI